MGLFIGNHFHFCLESIFGRGVVELFKWGALVSNCLTSTMGCVVRASISPVKGKCLQRTTPFGLKMISSSTWVDNYLENSAHFIKWVTLFSHSTHTVTLSSLPVMNTPLLISCEDYYESSRSPLFVNEIPDCSFWNERVVTLSVVSWMLHPIQIFTISSVTGVLEVNMLPVQRTNNGRRRVCVSQHIIWRSCSLHCRRPGG